jgi:putative transposase
MNGHYSISELCEAFDVSRSGYHAWSTRAPSARDQDDAKLAPLIEAAHTEGRRDGGA